MQSQNYAAAVHLSREELDGYSAEPYPKLPHGNHHYAPVTDAAVRVFAKLDLNGPEVSRPFTVATYVKAAWALVLAAMGRSPSQTHDVCFGTTVSCKMAQLAECGEISSPTFHMIPVRVRFDLQDTVGNYLKRVNDRANATTSFEYVGSSNISNISTGARSACLFGNILSVQDVDSLVLLEGHDPRPGSLLRRRSRDPRAGAFQPVLGSQRV